jgi:arylformamidase
VVRHHRPGLPGQRQRLTLSPHVGAHADAPLHYDAKAPALGRVDLDPTWALPRDPRHRLRAADRVAHMAHAIGHATCRRACWCAPTRACRWTAGTASWRPTRPQTIERLADLGVLLVGIDTASIDPADSKTLDSHQVIRRRGLRVLENLVLDDVPEGDYELIALPLKLTTADASPVRAVLREL